MRSEFRIVQGDQIDLGMTQVKIAGYDPVAALLKKAQPR